MNEAARGSFLERHEFLLRRLHSLSGLVPIGAYMCIHLVTNASILESSATFQKAVFQIHSLPLLPVIEWVFIFLPLIYHAVYGMLIVRGSLPNSSTYRYGSNIRYTMQRATGIIAFFFIFWHVFHMHGWIHTGWWERVAHPLGGAMFRPFNAASSAAEAMRISAIVPVLYAIGVLSCVFHLANGIWTFGITWGIWVSPAAQRRATFACWIFGIALAFVGLGALGGFAAKVDVTKAREIEDTMYEAKVKSLEIAPDPAKRSEPIPVEQAAAPGEPAATGSVEP